MKLTLSLCALVCAALLFGETVEYPNYRKVVGAGPNGKKIIYFGWMQPNSLAAFNSAFENFPKNCPIDGIGIRPSFPLKRDGKIINYRISHPDRPLQKLTHEDFAEWIPAMRRLQQVGLKHNFILTASILFNADWFDDEAWALTMNNFSTMAWLAKEAGFKGLCLDIEPYSFCGMPFMYRAELGHTFEETAIQVRKRAREWTLELNRQFPGLTLFTSFWTSQCDSAAKAAAPEVQNASQTGLQIAFFNGVYDVAPDDMTIVDGNESSGYNAWQTSDYDAFIAKFMRYGDAWIAPEHRAKFWRQTQVGIALYLDSYVPREGATTWNIFTKTDNPTKLLQTNIRRCLDYADEYVWIWAERGTFWPKVVNAKPNEDWNYRLPYCMEAIAAGKEPFKEAMKYADKRNRVNNSTFEAGDSGPSGGPEQYACGIRGWSLYQNKGAAKGTVVSEKGCARMKGIGSGCMTQKMRDFEKGKTYIISVKAKKVDDNVMPTFGFFYRNAQGQGLWSLTQHGTFTAPDADGWMMSSIMFTVPTDVDADSITINVGCAGGGGDLLVTDARMHEVSFPWENLKAEIRK